MRHLPRSIRSPAASRRAGSLLPATAVALLAILGGAALVVDRLALDAAKNELRIAAEAAALAATRELANDDRLRPDFDPAALQMKCRFAAARIAGENFIAGEPLQLNIEPDGDIRFGRLVKDPGTGEAIFIEVSDEGEPLSVVVRGRRTTARDSAIQLPLRTLYSPADADVVAAAEATLDFQVIGLRPVDGAPIPTLPLAISSTGNSDGRGDDESSSTSRGAAQPSDQSSSPTSSWTREIEERRGADQFGYDASTGEVTDQSDGIPEITLRTAASSGGSTSNAFVVALTGELTESALRRQILAGWSAEDLESVGGELVPEQGPSTMAGLRGVDSNMLATSLRKILGQSRVVLLYDRAEGDSNANATALHVSGMVAGRVMAVREISESECEIIFQPAVLATRSAVTAADGAESVAEKNKYIASLRLTN